MRRYLIIALGLATLGASFTYVPPAFASKAKKACISSCYCPFSKTGCQRLCERRCLYA